MADSMRFGVVFPQTEAGVDPGAWRDYFVAVEEMGFDHVLAGHHDLGIREIDGRLAKTWPIELPRQPYGLDDQFHDVFVLFGFVAALTSLGLMTNVLVLPQRQTVAVAKMASTLDVASRGRLRLGVSAGWNRTEFDAMGASFDSRGARLEEQIEVLRLLWSVNDATFAGAFHNFSGVGIAPMPVQRPIPVWMGAGKSRVSLERVGRLADGWTPVEVPGRGLEASLEVVRAAASAAGRDPASLGLQGAVPIGDRDDDATARRIDRWRTLGATHVAFETWRSGLTMPDGHIAALADAAAVARTRDRC